MFNSRLTTGLVLGVLACSLPRIVFAASAPAPKIAVRSVTFVKAGMLSAQEQDDIAAKLKKRESAETADLSAWASEALQRVRTAYQDKGYFKVGVTASIAPVLEASEDHQVDIRIGRQRIEHALQVAGFEHVAILQVFAGRLTQRGAEQRVVVGDE